MFIYLGRNKRKSDYNDDEKISSIIKREKKFLGYPSRTTMLRSEVNVDSKQSKQTKKKKK